MTGSLRPFLLGCGAAVVFLLATSSSVGALGGTTRQDVDNGFYLVGGLTWSGGRGGISWSGAASDDTGGPGANKDKDAFTSEPLPFDLHLNSSRMLWLDVYTKDVPSVSGTGSSCGSGGRLSARALLLVEDRIVGGSDGDDFNLAWNGHNTTFPPDPPGFGVCRLRMASEVGVLPKGTVLTLHLTMTSGDGSMAGFGFGGDHRSVLRLPYFPEEEIPYRYPVYAHGLPSKGSGGTPADALITGLGLGGLAASVGRPRRAAALLPVLLLFSGLAGCVGRQGPASPEAGGDLPSNSLEPQYQKGNLSKSGLGSLIGEVRSSDVGQAIEGAYVALLGTERATRTDPYGRFTFRDLTAGTYRLRVDRDGYQPFEATVNVVEDLIARFEVPLVPIGSTEGGQRPHRHDYWGEEEEKVLIDRLKLETRCAQTFGVCFPAPASGVVCSEASGTVSGFCNEPGISAFAIPLVEKDFATIRPGTYEVIITADWVPACLGREKASLAFQANNDPSFANVSVLAPRGPGVPFHIATTWEMQDSGHQRFSTWTFQVLPDEESKRTEREYCDDAGFTVTLSIHKGTVPLEPAHPDLWRGQSSLDVIRNETRLAQALPISNWNFAWLPSRLIPPETTSIDVWANASRATLPDYEVDLRYRSASAAPSVRCWSSYHAVGAACDGPEYLHPPETRTGTSHHWRILVTPEEADPFYAARSFWAFGLQTRDTPMDTTAAMADYYVNFAANVDSADGILRYSLTVIAHR